MIESCIGAIVSTSVGWVASIMLDGFGDQYHRYTVKGQLREYERENLPMKQDNWYVVPGKIDRASWFLLAYFFLCIFCLGMAEQFI